MPTESCFEARLSAIGARTTLAGLLIAHVGDWPRYVQYFVRSLSPNAEVITAYFLSPTPPPTSGCRNCVWLPLDLTMMAARISRFLGVNDSWAMVLAANKHKAARKLCDTRVFVASLFPEVARRHQWVGYSDYDLALADLTTELRSLDLEGFDVLSVDHTTYRKFSNGPFHLTRVHHAASVWKHSAIWRDVLRNPEYMVFDEWWGPNPNQSMDAVYKRLFQAGQLKIKWLSLPILDDHELGPSGPPLEPPPPRLNASEWHDYEVVLSPNGTLTAEYDNGQRRCTCNGATLACTVNQPLDFHSRFSMFHFLRNKRGDQKLMRAHEAEDRTLVWSSCDKT